MSDPSAEAKKSHSDGQLTAAIRKEVSETRKGLVLWKALHYALLISGVAFPALAAIIGGKSVADNQPFKPFVSDPQTGWKTTCGYISLLALAGALANTLHKGLKAEKEYDWLLRKKIWLKQILAESDAKERHKKFNDLLDEEKRSHTSA